MTTDANNRHSFILRIWRENDNLEWKSWVQHAGSGESSPLIKLSDLCPFIEQYIAELDTPALEKHIQKNPIRKSGLK